MYSAIIDGLGLRDWCDADKKPSLLSLSKLKGEQPEWYDVKFPSLDNLHMPVQRSRRRATFQPAWKMDFWPFGLRFAQCLTH